MNVPMVADDLFLNTFVGDIPQPVSNVLNEVEQELIKPNQYEGTPVQQLNQQNSTPYIAAFADSGSVTLTKDVVIFSLQVALRVTGVSKSMDMLANINAGQIAATFITTDAATSRAEANYFVAIPYYKLTKGDKITVSISYTAGAGHDARVIFLGYEV